MKIDKYPIPDACLYCNGYVILTTNDFIYNGRQYGKNGNYNCYVCIVCKASVGTHQDGVTPLGRLADKELKLLKIEAHSLFDPIWKSGKMKRHQAYSLMAKRLGIPVNECHFGWFDKDMLLKAIQILERRC
jgi:hypothetical protein